MPIFPTIPRASRRIFAAGLPLVLFIAACGAAAGPSPTTPGDGPRSTPTAVPGVGGGGGSGGNTGGGIIDPMPPDDIQDPWLGDANTVVPVAGRVDPHQINVQHIRAVVDAEGVRVELRWYSGVAPCYVLDSVVVARDEPAKTVKLTVIEGSNAGDNVCIDLAQLKATVVDLGDLAAGTWTISAEGDAQAITVEVG